MKLLANRLLEQTTLAKSLVFRRRPVSSRFINLRPSLWLGVDSFSVVSVWFLQALDYAGEFLHFHFHFDVSVSAATCKLDVLLSRHSP